MIGYMLIKLNRPLLTRSNLSKGKEVSMLMFIKSKKQMQKLFDPSTEMTSSINEPEVNINDSNQSYEEAQIQTYIDALQYEEGTFV
jgi:hypothetical protein